MIREPRKKQEKVEREKKREKREREREKGEKKEEGRMELRGSGGERVVKSERREGSLG